MRIAVRLFITAFVLASSLAAQSNAPTKLDPKGYKDLVEPGKRVEMSDIGEGKAAKKAAEEPQAPGPDVPADLAKIVAAQFGPDCKIAMSRTSLVVNYRTPDKATPWTPFLIADLDHDGIEDAIIVARCENALARRDEFSYTMVDPYMSFHGYGDPKITAEFASGDPMQGHVVLIIHGVGAEGWRAAKPKSKFLVLNLPFSNIGLTHVAAKKGKAPVNALLLQEGETMSSVMFWDGKKYKWRDSIGNQ